MQDKDLSSLLPGHVWRQREGEIPVEDGNLGGSVAETANLGEI